jgi:hypothetical protein
MNLGAETRVRMAAHTVTRTLDDTVALLDVNSGTYYTIDEVGIIFVELCGEGASLGEIARRVASEYEVGENEALGDLAALAEELVTEGLAETVAT